MVFFGKSSFESSLTLSSKELTFSTILAILSSSFWLLDLRNFERKFKGIKHLYI